MRFLRDDEGPAPLSAGGAGLGSTVVLMRAPLPPGVTPADGAVDVGAGRPHLTPCARRGTLAIVKRLPRRLALEPAADFADRAHGVGGAGKIDLDVVLRPRIPPYRPACRRRR